MPFSLIPKLILPSLTDVTPEMLAARGVRFLMLDFDNTIVPYTTNEPAEAMTAWTNFTPLRPSVTLGKSSSSAVGTCPAFFFRMVLMMLR